MILVCAWCKQELQRRPETTDSAVKELVSHGICSDCRRKLEGKEAKKTP